MIKPVLFIDIDGVMADSIAWWLTLHNLRYGTKITKDQVTEWDTKKCVGADLTPYFDNYDRVKPIPRSLLNISLLKTSFRIVFATAGSGSNWLRQYILKPEIIQIKDKSLLRGFALIDDNPINLDGFIGERFLLSQPWNRNRGLNESNWDDITRHLMNYKGVNHYER